MINAWIVFADIHERKIPNISLWILLGILPFWIWLSSSTHIDIGISNILFSIILLIWGIFLYHSSAFLGSGDIKYAAILVLFMGHHTLSDFVGNLAILTLLCFFVWLVIVIGYIYKYRWSLGLDVVIDHISPKIPKNEIYLYILAYILDFGIVGFMINQLIPQIWVMMSYTIDMSENIYFLIFLVVYMIRPWSNYLITRWKYKIISIFLICVYFGLYLQDNGIYSLYSEVSQYVWSLWLYILVYIIIRSISTSIYRLYDYSTTLWWWEYFKTVPYSIVIFIAFITTYTLNMSIMQWLETIF